ncbi:MAG: DMT family transporter [Thermomicrobiales bacterium]|nr:DMT family transporter [Thermomicrobiales bacterium]
MSTRYRDTAILILLAALWGFSYIFIRVAVPAFGPIGLSLARVGIGAVGILGWMAVSGSLDQIPRIDRRFLILAVLNAVIPYALIAFAELHVSASFAAIASAITPLFTAVIVAVMARERLGGGLATGLAAGIGGVGILVGWSPIPFSGIVLLAVLALLIAYLSYGAAGVYAKRNLAGTSSLGMAMGQQLAATFLLVPIGAGSMAVGEADKAMSLNPILATIALGLICTAFAYLLYFHLIKAIGPVRTSSVTFLIPPFGILWGWLFLDEHIKPSMIVGLALILVSIRLVNRPTSAKPHEASATEIVSETA